MNKEDTLLLDLSIPSIGYTDADFLVEVVEVDVSSMLDRGSVYNIVRRICTHH
jgi:hypothetical protein